MSHGYESLCPHKDLVAQLKARDAIPPEVWGPDLARRKLAIAIGEIVKDEMFWPNASFIPEDPFVLLAYDPDDPGDWDAKFLDTRIGELLGWELGRDLPGQLAELTFGEAVDVLLDKSPGFRERVRLAVQAPLDGPEVLESRPCPCLAAFLSLRAFVATWELGSPTRAIQPGTRIRRALPAPVLRQLDTFVRDRFGVDARLTDTAGDDASMASCLAVATALGGGYCSWAWISRNDEGWLFLHLLVGLPVVFVAGIGTIACLRFAWSALRQYLSRCARAVGIGKRPRIVTFADLVRRIVSERAKHTPHPQAAE